MNTLHNTISHIHSYIQSISELNNLIKINNIEICLHPLINSVFLFLPLIKICGLAAISGGCLQLFGVFPESVEDAKTVGCRCIHVGLLFSDLVARAW